jgi:cytosine/adenosine deaminase-related metal-dependent hydrolase
VILRLESLSWRESYPARGAITVAGGDIAAMGQAAGGGAAAHIDFEGGIAFPGLINAHDHLDFDLYPALGRGPYSDYAAWALDIQRRHRAEIDPVVAIPAALRARWGQYKNLLAGVTTVVHHGAPVAEDVVEVVSSFQYLHSLRFGGPWRTRLALPGRAPLMLHLAEGTSAAAAREADRLRRWNLWRRKVIGVHGIALTVEQARRLEALVWCPVSNLFLYGQTAPVEALKAGTRILFGTDSTASGGWNIWDHLRAARRLGKLGDAELQAAVGEMVAQVLSLPGQGRLAVGYRADLVIARTDGKRPGFWDAFYAVDPADLLMVLRRGRIVLVDGELWPQARPLVEEAVDRVVVGGRTKMVVGGLAALASAIAARHPGVAFPVEIVPGAG